MNDSPASSPAHRFTSPVWGIIASILFVSVIVGVLLYFDMHHQLVALLRWVEDQGPWAALLFIAIMAAAVVLLLPGIFFTAGAGFVFGVVEGSIYVVLGTTIGATIAFLIARYFFGRRAARFIVAHSGLKHVNAEMSRHDFKVVLLTRLIPFFPAKLSNYFFGLTSFSLRSFVLGSLIGFIPFSVHNVYLGSIAASLATLGDRQLGRTPLEWGLYGLGFAATVVAVVFFNRLARRALARYTSEMSEEQEEP